MFTYTSNLGISFNSFFQYQGELLTRQLFGGIAPWPVKFISLVQSSPIFTSLIAARSRKPSFTLPQAQNADDQLTTNLTPGSPSTHSQDVGQICFRQGPEGAPVPLLPNRRAQLRDEVCHCGRTGPENDANNCYYCRSFLTRAYPIMKKNNPTIPILLREAQGTLPRIYARYGPSNVFDMMLWNQLTDNGCRVWKREERVLGR